jgi:hypothetical protein
MTLDIHDDWLLLIATAAEHKLLAGRALNREDGQYAEIQEFFQAAADQPQTIKLTRSRSLRRSETRSPLQRFPGSPNSSGAG